jgi:hypothetical protein
MKEEYAGNAHVIFLSTVDSAWKYIKRYRRHLKGAILDMMMDPGQLFAEEARAELGLRTGALLYEKIRAIAPNLNIMVFSNVTEQKVVDRFSKQEQNCQFNHKPDFLPFELVNKARAFFG